MTLKLRQIMFLLLGAYHRALHGNNHKISLSIKWRLELFSRLLTRQYHLHLWERLAQLNHRTYQIPFRYMHTDKRSECAMMANKRAGYGADNPRTALPPLRL
jgi:hypothetical protein